MAGSSGGSGGAGLLTGRHRAVQAVILLALGVLVGGLFGFISYLVGLSSQIPTIVIPVVGVWILPIDVVFSVGFLVAVLGGVAYLAFHEQLAGTLEALGDAWSALPSLVRALIVGLPVAAAVELAIALIGLYGGSRDPTLRIGVFLGLWLVATLLAYLGRGLVRGVLVKTGLAQRQRLQTLTFVFAAGFLFAILVSIVLQFLVGEVLVTVVGFLLAFLVGSAIALRATSGSTARTDLVLADVRERTSNRSRELSIRNDGDGMVDLRDAKIRDTQYDIYRMNMNDVLMAGQTGRFTVAPGFALYPSENDLGLDLPFGISISQGADAPVIVTRNGEEYELQFAAERGEPGDAETERSDGRAPSNV